MTESAGHWTSVPSTPFAGETPKTGRKLSGLSLLLDEEARIRSSASISPMASQSAPSSSSKPKFSISVDGDRRDVETLVALPKPVVDAPSMEFGSFYQSYKSDDLDILPDAFHIPLAAGQPQAAPKADASLSSFSFDVHDDDKQVLTCAELIDFILRFAKTNEEFVASPSSRSLWHLTTVRLVAADEKGEPLNDLPLDLSATADVLNLGLTDFAIVDRSGDRTLMHIRIEGTIHGNVPYSGNTTAVDMPYTSLNRPQDDGEDAEGDQPASRSRSLRRADRSDDSLLMISSEDSASSFDTMRRQTSIESLEPDVITVFKMDTEERISGVTPLVAHDESFEALGSIRLESPSSVRGSGKRKKEKRLKRRSLVKRSDSATSNTSAAPTPSSRGRSSSGSLLISCRRWGTDRWKVAKEIALTPSGSVVWATTPASSQKKPPQLQSSRLLDSDEGSARSAHQMDTRSVKPFQNVRDDAPWFDDFSYSSPPAGSPAPPLPSSASKTPFPSSTVRKPRASSSPSTAHSGASSALTTPASSGKATKAKAASNFFSSQHDEELLRRRSSIILVPAAGDPGLERRHSERPYDEDNDVIDILKYQRQTPSILTLEKTGALQTIFPHTSQPLLAKFSPKHSNSPTPAAPGAAPGAPDGSPPLSRRKLRRSRSDSQNGDAEPDDEDAESRATAANLGTILEHQQYPQQLRERRLRAMSSLSNSSRGGGGEEARGVYAKGGKPPSAASLDADDDASDDDVFDGSGRPIYAHHSSDGYDSEYDAGSQQSAAALLSAAALSAQAPAHSSAALLLSYKSAAAQSSRGSSSHRSLSPFHTSSASSQHGSDAAAEAVGAAKLQRPQHQRHHHPHLAHRPPHTPKTLLKSAAKPPSPSPVVPTVARATSTAATATTTQASEVTSPTGEEAAATSPQKPGAQSRSALSSGVSTPTQRSSLSGLFSPSRPTDACGSAPGSRRGSSNSSFFGRLYDSLLRISSPALPPTGPSSAGVALDASDPTDDPAAADDVASAGRA